MSVRIARRSNDQRGTVDLSQTVLHPIAIHHPMAFRRHLTGPQRVDHEALQQIDIISGIERLPARPELSEMSAVGTKEFYRSTIDGRGFEDECTPYTCEGGACRTSCASSDDCVSGFTCDTGSSLCVSTGGGH